VIVHRAGRPVTAGGVVLIPLERLLLGGTAEVGSVRGFAGLEPTGVAVLSPRGLVIFDETGSLSPIFPRLDEVEGLRSALSILAFPGAGQSG
jgi:hypothetical protein